MISSRRLSDLHPEVQKRATTFIALAEMELSKALGEPVSLMVIYTYRDAEFQDKLYAQGRTDPGKIVTNARGGQSIHQYRCAFDVGIVIDRQLTWDKKYYKLLGPIAKQCDLTWGGDWNGNGVEDKNDWDLCHFQWTGGLTLADLQAGKELPLA